MARKLGSGAAVEIFQSIDSTSLEAKRRAADGEAGPLWLIAIEQTSGYGRRGAEWRQREGDIAASFLFTPDVRGDLAQLSFVAAVALTETIAGFAPGAHLSLKWPNDVLAGGAKISGLLLELVDDAARAKRRLCLGVGVNIVSKPADLDYKTAAMIDLIDGAPPSPLQFVEALDRNFAAWRTRWLTEGFEPVRETWLALAAKRGEIIRVRKPGGDVTGRFADIDLSGALVLDCDGEMTTITAGEVFFGNNIPSRPERFERN